MLADGVWYFVVLALINLLNVVFYRATSLEDVQVRQILHFYRSH
jgi:hypothetical protein